MTTGRKSRILLVDDHRQILDTVSTFLAQNFEVVGCATGGREALEQSQQLNPDAIVLDLEMPGLDGFQTLRALEQTGRPVPPVVFLSMHDRSEVVSEAFRRGALGYVVKPRVGRDLVAALDQALHNRRFVPSLIPLVTNHESGHAMQIYEEPESFAEGLAEVFDRALRRGDATCAILNRGVRDHLRDRLRARGWHVDAPSGHRRYLAIDAGDALRRFMRNGVPDRDCLAEIARELDDYRRAQSTGSTSWLTVAGNTVVELCVQDNPSGAIALETCWNDLTGHLPFVTICGYASSCFNDRVPGLWGDACQAHGALSHASDV